MIDLLARRREMMGASGGEDIYKDMLTLEFSVEQSYTVNITTSNTVATRNIDKIIIDGVDIGSITTSMSYTFEAGRHKIGWLMLDITTIPQNVIANIAPANSLPTNKITTIPSCVETLGNYAMRGIPAYSNDYFVVKPSTPPACGTGAIGLWNASVDRPIYVPNDSVDAYKAASSWSTYTSAYKPMSQLPTT